MADFGGPQRVRKLRERRAAEGFVETNISIPKDLREVIDSKVASGAYESRRWAIIDALQKVFMQQDQQSR
jgi:metal-responsive CopG/Arc/MetJ family transcriptional regulator